MTFTQGHALVIGVGTYQHAPARDGAPDVADAQAVADVLRDERFCGYPDAQVSVLTGPAATRERIDQALDQLCMRVGADDTVFIFYSGHGQHDRHGTYHLLTHDSYVRGESVEPGTSLSEQALLGRLAAIKAKRLLFICNACYAGYLSSLRIDQLPHYSDTRLPTQTADALLATGSGRIVITAAREDQRAFVGPGPLSLFSQALVDGLRGESIDVQSRHGFISLFDLYIHLYNRLAEWVPARVPAHLRHQYNQHTQQPEMSMLKGVGSFAIALYHGAVAQATSGAREDVPPGLAVRAVDPADSQRALAQLLQGGVASNQTLAARDMFSGTHLGPDLSIRLGNITGVDAPLAIGHGTIASSNARAGRSPLSDVYRRITLSDESSVVKQVLEETLRDLECSIADRTAAPDRIEMLLQLIDRLSPTVGHTTRAALQQR